MKKNLEGDHTLSFVRAPTTYGPTKPGIVASIFVIPTNVPKGKQ